MKKIIHVDNSEFFRKLVSSFLQGEGFEVESFSSAQEASLSIIGGILDMVIMGLTFADANGEEFLNRILESFTGPVIVISASVDENKNKELLAKGVTAAIHKSGPWQQSLKPHLSALKQR
jgi:CheY-like chemotaxis protein